MSKIEDKKLRKIPIEIVGNINSYSIKDTDTRFTEVLIKVLHTGKNFNGSIFKKEVVEKALPTMKNTPILAFIEKNSENEDDFSEAPNNYFEEADNSFDNESGNPSDINEDNPINN